MVVLFNSTHCLVSNIIYVYFLLGRILLNYKRDQKQNMDIGTIFQNYKDRQKNNNSYTHLKMIIL